MRGDITRCPKCGNHIGLRSVCSCDGQSLQKKNKARKGEGKPANQKARNTTRM